MTTKFLCKGIFKPQHIVVGARYTDALRKAYLGKR